MSPIRQMTRVGKIVICPVDSIITEQKFLTFRLTFPFGTQLYSSDYAASSTVDANVRPVLIGHLVNGVYASLDLIGATPATI